MELTKRQNKWYDLGIKMAHKYSSEEESIYAMSADELEHLEFGRWSNSLWFHAGFAGRTPEYVRAIRFGKVPSCGQSKNWASGALEDGTSCVKIIRQEQDETLKSIYDITVGCQGTEKLIIEGWYLGGSGSDC